MQKLSAQLFSILAKYAGVTSIPISPATRLAELEIDELDLPIILLDLEDVVGVAIDIVPDAATTELLTVADIAALAHSAITRSRQPIRRASPRRKSNWMSTSARTASTALPALAP